MNSNDESQTAEALRWITGVLVDCGAEFQAVGGLAARAFGATRPIVDPCRTENPFHLEYQDENRKKGRLPGQERLRIRYGSYRTPWFDFLFVSVEELERLASGAGWRLQEVIPSTGAAFVGVLQKTQDARRRPACGAMALT